MPLPQDLVTRYAKPNPERHKFYKYTVDVAEHLQFHTDGYKTPNSEGAEDKNPYFEKLITWKRPGESTDAKDAREKLYVDETTETTGKVFNNLKKIPSANDFEVSYKNAEVPARVISDTPHDYFEKNYPVYESVTNYIFNSWLKKDASDPNGLNVVLPKTFEISESDLYEPVSYFVPSKNVFEYVEGEVAIMQAPEEAFYMDGDTRMDAKVYWIFLPGQFYKLIQIGSDKWAQVDVTQAGTANQIFWPAEFPAWRTGARITYETDKTKIYKSFIHEMLPKLDMAALENNDLRASTLIALHPTEWHIEGGKCTNCNGTGKVRLKNGGNKSCGECKGKGRPIRSPFTTFEVSLPKVGQQNIPTPPMGIVEKDVAIMEFMEQRIKRLNHQALAAVNMEFSAETPLNQSGKAKEYDMEGLNTFVQDVARHAVTTMRKIYRISIEFRYGVILPDEKTRKSMLPVIPEPIDFNIITANIKLRNLRTLKEAEVHPSIVVEQELDYAGTEFKNQPETKAKIETIISLDPFPGKKAEDVQNDAITGLISKRDGVLHLYITSFVNRAIEENEKFLELDRKEQLAVLDPYITEVIDQENAGTIEAED